jgi:putative transposase
MQWHPKKKKKNKREAKMYFVKNDAKMVIECERHRIKIPTLGWVRLKEKGYIPADEIIRSGTVSMKAGRYYVSVLVDSPILNEVQSVLPGSANMTDGIGIDLGLKDFAVMPDKTTKKNINKKSKVKKIEKKLRREQRKLSRKYEKINSQNLRQNKKSKGEATKKNIEKQVIRVQELHQRLDNIRTDYINKIVHELVRDDLAKTKPSYIAVEDLNIRGMMKNKHLSKSVAQQKFFEFRIKLENKCRQNGIELRIVDRFYPSSKLCHECGNIKSDLKLSDRTYICECGYEADRDFNASLNLRDAKIYKIA